jgi:hypothetical protein
MRDVWQSGYCQHSKNTADNLHRTISWVSISDNGKLNRITELMSTASCPVAFSQVTGYPPLARMKTSSGEKAFMFLHKTEDSD